MDTLSFQQLAIISRAVDFIGQNLCRIEPETPAILFNVCFQMTAFIEGIPTQFIQGKRSKIPSIL
jgi:hypothetical protein